MIRTLIEVEAKDDYEHERQLKKALDQLGYEPKPSADDTRFMSDLHAALHAKGLESWNLVSEYRAARQKDSPIT